MEATFPGSRGGTGRREGESWSNLHGRTLTSIDVRARVKQNSEFCALEILVVFLAFGVVVSFIVDAPNYSGCNANYKWHLFFH